MAEGEENNIDIQVVAVDGHEALFVLVVRPAPNGHGIECQSSANGISREGAIKALRMYADALESGAATTTDRR
jgi:hypothetical protein